MIHNRNETSKEISDPPDTERKATELETMERQEACGQAYGDPLQVILVSVTMADKARGDPGYIQ